MEISCMPGLASKKFAQTFGIVIIPKTLRDVIAEMLNTYKTLGCKMSIKVHFLNSHSNFFHKNMSDVPNEHGEQFHRDISDIENRYKGKWSVGTLADYCWSIQRDDSETQHKRRRR